jgi:hypothetical protein
MANRPGMLVGGDATRRMCLMLAVIQQLHLINVGIARCTREIKSRIAMAKTAFNKKNNLFTSKLDLNLRKKLVKCYLWNIALYGAETWTLRKVDQKYLQSFEMWC